MNRQNTSPKGRPSVASQLATPGSRCATTSVAVPSGPAGAWARLRLDRPAQVVEGLELAVPQGHVGAAALGPADPHDQGVVGAEQVGRHAVGGIGRGQRVGAGRAPAAGNSWGTRDTNAGGSPSPGLAMVSSVRLRT